MRSSWLLASPIRNVPVPKPPKQPTVEQKLQLAEHAKRHAKYEESRNLRLAIDPSIDHLAISVWTEDGRLYYAGLLEACEVTEKIPSRVIKPAVAFEYGASDTIKNFRSLLQRCHKVTIELPEIYQRQGQWKGNPNDLILLARVVGATELYFRYLADAIVTVLPKEWKGNIPKDVCARRIRKKLSPNEIRRIELPSNAGLDHNVWDAVGIGLWAYSNRWRTRGE